MPRGRLTASCARGYRAIHDQRSADDAFTGAAFVLPALWIGMLLRTEVGVAIAAVTAQIREGAFVLPEFVRTLPWIGDRLQAMVGELTRAGGAARATHRVGAPERRPRADADRRRRAQRGQTGFRTHHVFFLYRDGERVLEQVVAVLPLPRRAPGPLSLPRWAG